MNDSAMRGAAMPGSSGGSSGTGPCAETVESVEAAVAVDATGPDLGWSDALALGDEEVALIVVAGPGADAA